MSNLSRSAWSANTAEMKPEIDLNAAAAAHSSTTLDHDLLDLRTAVDAAVDDSWATEVEGAATQLSLQRAVANLKTVLTEISRCSHDLAHRQVQAKHSLANSIESNFPDLWQYYRDVVTRDQQQNKADVRSLQRDIRRRQTLLCKIKLLVFWKYHNPGQEPFRRLRTGGKGGEGGRGGKVTLAAPTSGTGTASGAPSLVHPLSPPSTKSSTSVTTAAAVTRGTVPSSPGLMFSFTPTSHSPNRPKVAASTTTTPATTISGLLSSSTLFSTAATAAAANLFAIAQQPRHTQQQSSSSPGNTSATVATGQLSSVAATSALSASPAVPIVFIQIVSANPPSVTMANNPVPVIPRPTTRSTLDTIMCEPD